MSFCKSKERTGCGTFAGTPEERGGVALSSSRGPSSSAPGRRGVGWAAES